MSRWALVVVACAAACGKRAREAPGDAPPRPIDATPRDAARPADAPSVDATAATTTPPGPLVKALQIAVRGRVACARLADGRVRCWGRTWDGTSAPIAAAPVELPNVTNAVAVEITPKGALYVVTSDGRVLRTSSELTRVTPLEEVPQTTEAIDVRVLDEAPFVLARSGNLEGQLRSNPKLTDVIAVRTEGDRGLALHRDGHVTAFTVTKASAVRGLTDVETLIGFGCGRRRGGALVCWDARGKQTAWKGPANIVERAAGDHFSCDLTGSGVACTGWNDVGQLGTGPEPDRATPRLVDLPDKPIAIAAGERSACAVLETGAVACWGANDGGQLGDGTLRDRPRPAIIAGATSVKAPPPSDGLRDVEEAAEPMSWDGLPQGCVKPASLPHLDRVVSAYAFGARDGGELWFGDFRLQPGGYRAGSRPVRADQHVVVIKLVTRGAIARGRYRDTGARRASLIVHDATGSSTFAKGIDLVIERADKAWVCGQLLDRDPAKRQPFAARVEKITR
jgi:hypothetical protein